MAKLVTVFLFVLLTGCANIGFDGIEVYADDTWFTILAPAVLLIVLYVVKKEIDLWYFKREQKLLKSDEDEIQ